METIKKAPKEEERVPVEIHEWNEEDYAVLVGNLSLLRNIKNLKEDPKAYHERALDVYDELISFFEDYGGSFKEDVNDIYKKYAVKPQPSIVRKEDPANVLKVFKEKSLEMNFDPKVVDKRGDKYVNCALWPYGPVNATSGIANAFLEGRGMAGPIAIVMGIKENSKYMKILEAEDSMQEIGTIQRYGVRILDGEIHPEDIQFLIVRVAGKFFAPEKLTENEKKSIQEGKNIQIFRGIDFGE